MNTNGQILAEANDLISDIRKQKEAITELSNVKSGLSGGTQKNISISAGGSCIDIGMTGRNYATVTRKQYSLASTFIRRGISIEIENRKLIIELLTKKLNSLTFDV
tara:strand:- start:1077 stop:1394 length:318 start_codon:yes stop_codon:yes gene_type:complete